MAHFLPTKGKNQNKKNRPILTLGKAVKLVCVASFFLKSGGNPLMAAPSPDARENFFQTAQESREIKGKVTFGSDNTPVPGATIVVKGTVIGTTSDANGNYTIKVNSNKDVLVVSFIGYANQEVPVGNNTEINIGLLEESSTLNEVTVVGYGEQRKVSVVGAISSVSVKELDQPVANISTTLAGRVPGLVGVQRSGQPGYDGADIWIRGIGAFTANSPLILVDGVERSMNNINPDDIESFSILKDASATAVYGVLMV